MNERIKQIKEQAFNFVAKQNMCKKEYFWENIRHNPELQDSVDAKFAELIVKECMETIEMMDAHSDKRDIDDMYKAVEKHFGVEE